MAMKKGDIKDAHAYAKAGDQMGIAVGRPSNDRFLEGTAERRYADDLLRSGEQPEPTGLDAYDFRQRANQGALPLMRSASSTRDEFHSRWKEAKAAGNQELADDIIAEGQAAGLRLSGAGLQRFAARRQRLERGPETTVPQTAQAAPAQGSYTSPEDIAVMRNGVQSAQEYLSPEASAQREAEKAAMLQPYEDRLQRARQRTLEVRQQTDALPSPSAAFVDRFSGEDGIDLGKVKSYADKRMGEVATLENRNQGGLDSAIGRMEGERQQESQYSPTTKGMMTPGLVEDAISPVMGKFPSQEKRKDPLEYGYALRNRNNRRRSF